MMFRTRLVSVAGAPEDDISLTLLKGNEEIFIIHNHFHLRND